MKLRTRLTKKMLQSIDNTGKELGQLTLKELQYRLYYQNKAFQRRTELLWKIASELDKEIGIFLDPK